MGAGILPVAFNGISLVFLLGKEQNNQWSDFGGTSSIYETTFDTAIREGYEELSGLLGTKNQLRNTVRNNLIFEFYNNRYTTYLFRSEYDENLVTYFNLNYQFVKNTTPGIIKVNHNGLYEKKEIAWFTREEIYNLELRPFYKNVIYPILKNKKIEKLF